MNFGEMQEYLERRVLKDTDSDPEALPLVINMAHLEIQRCHDWSVMESHQVLPYQPTGITLDNSTLRVGAVYLAQATTTPVSRGEALDPITRDWREAERQQHSDHHHSEPGGHHRRQWWIQEGRVFVKGWEDCGTTSATAPSLWLDVFRTLPDYQATSDTDWFSVNAWDLVIYKAAAIGYVDLFDEKKIAFFEMQAEKKLARVKEVDQRFKDGGASNIYRPPIPHYWPVSAATLEPYRGRR